MLLDVSFYGMVDAVKKAGKVLAYHVFSAAVVAAFAALGEQLGKLQIAHPIYAVYLASAIAAVNVLAVLVKEWITKVNPDRINTAVQVDPTPSDPTSTFSA